ncbi:hypothetical protein A946_00070 [Methylacidiphilum kamchatkense Kam1]|uniref:Uncharacterized protein n=1 Tax=Methylacidiphilum kamchatkense Kam1 TaxID=1202785 RepID=A0A0C1RW68_9BACT|nr:hypothetical protein A946_00070 [Methylacidiphilum kamchatkense Kam1]QDQ42875.1 hypothetical protein kam1_1660 [Methylacidiphilum kamchatkense Kam1]
MLDGFYGNNKICLFFNGNDVFIEITTNNSNTIRNTIISYNVNSNVFIDVFFNIRIKMTLTTANIYNEGKYCLRDKTSFKTIVYTVSQLIPLVNNARE